MSIPLRNSDRSNIIAVERTFFVTSSTWGKRALLQSDRSASLFVEVLYHYRSTTAYLLHEFVVMPDHVLITLSSDTSVERSAQLMKGGFAFRAGRELGLRAPVWQKGFSEIRVRTADEYLQFRDYIHQNPVRRFLSPDIVSFPFSSAHAGFELDQPPQRLKPLDSGRTDGIAKAMP